MVSLLSLKSIELQVALPRSQDAGKLQDQLSKEGQRFQESLVQSQMKEELKKRKTVNEFDEISKSKIKDEEPSREKESKYKKHANKEKAGADEKIEHPYLGSQIDFSG